MNFVYIYGPPGVGKFTVGKELSKRTGYRLFHNHLSIEFVRSVFDFGTPSFNRLVLKFRAEMIEQAAKDRISIVFTSAYAKGVNDKIVKDIVRRVEKHGGKIFFVQLHCDRKELMKRVTTRSKTGFYKIRSPKQLDSFLKKYDLTSPIPFEKSLTIDNTRIAPGKAADKIIKHFKLQKANKIR